jgi:hypothetical protein
MSETILPETLPAGASTAALQTQPGVDIGDVTVNNAAGASAVNIQDGGNAITVDGTVALAAGAANIGDVDVLTVPAPLSTTGGGTEAAALRVTLANDSTGLVSVDDNAASLTVDNSTLAVVGGGTEAAAMRVTIANDSTGLVSVDDNGGALTVDQATASSLNAQVVGNIAHDAADSGNPVKIGGVARTANPAAVAALDRADLYMDDLGRPCVRLYVPRDLISQNTTTITASTAETTILAQVASTFLDLTSIIAINTSATAVRVDFRDATAGTIRFSLYIPAGDTRGFALPVPMPQTTVNNNWTAQCSASVTDVRIFIQAVRDV